MFLYPLREELAARDAVLAAVVDCIRRDERIMLPAFDARASSPSLVALASVGVEPNPFGGTVGEFRYQFEGEEDLLHLIVTRTDGSEISVEDGRSVAGFLLSPVPLSLVWLRPGVISQHFYLGHDELVGAKLGGKGLGIPRLSG